MELSSLSLEELQSMKKEAETMAGLYKTRQNAFKTLGNSLYGSLGTPTFRFYDADIATAITLSGQAAINKMSITTNKYLSKLIGEEKEYIIAGDTDSAMINVSDLVKKLNVPDDKVVEFLAKFGETKLATAIDAGVQEFNIDTNAFKPRTAFKREKISRGILCLHGDSVIDIDSEKITIENLYKMYPDGSVDRTCLSYNTSTNEFDADVIEEVLCRDYDGEMIEFELDDGNKLKVTEDHIMFVYRDNKFLQIPAKEVLLSDDLVSL